MNKINRLLLTGCLFVYSSVALSSECNFTVAQDRLIKLSASYGDAFNYRKTLPAIVMQESFVGRYVVKINPNDGKLGSYGITHILLETAMWREGVDSRWEALDKIAPKLLNDDLYALKLAVKKLDSVHKGNWMNTWSAFNGGSRKYAENIRNNIRLLERCGYFDWE
jgi:hypothetical protein